jgi:hypothetical protein
MHDARIEDLIRGSLRDEADGLSMTITTRDLERRLAERRARVDSRRRVLAAAAIAAIALTGSALLFSRFPGQPAVGTTPLTSATPSPSASPLPDAAALLADVPDVTLRLERSAGAASGPGAPVGAPSPAASPTPVEVGRLTFTGPFVIAVACIGEGQMVAEVATPAYDVAYTQAVAPCDGRTVFSEYLAPPIDPSSPGDVVTVTAPEGASWRLAIGEYPASLLTEPEFAPIELTDGWNILANNGATLVSDRFGARVTPPAAATHVAALVQCIGRGTVSVSVPGSPVTDVACDETGATQRIVFPVVGGEAVGIDADVDRQRVWVRMVVETDAELAATYQAAPAMPPAIAAAPYTAPDQNVLAFGTLGSNHQTIIGMEDPGPGTPDGDLLPVARIDRTTAWLDLVSISSGELIKTVASVPTPAIIFDSWADATNGLVFYALSTADAIEFHRVTADGADDTLLATVARDTTSFTAALALDDSAFVIDDCSPSKGCVRTVVDGRTGAVDRFERTSEPICKIFGVVDGTLVGTSRPRCSEPTETTVLAAPVGSGAPTVLFTRDAGASLEGAFLVATSAAPRLVVPGSGGPGNGAPWDVVDTSTGETTTVPVAAADGVPMSPNDLRLPGGWILLVGGGLGDFPWQRAFDRPTPVLVNIVTGERIELVNLPHWDGNF